jgi:hypothetical protein
MSDKWFPRLFNLLVALLFLLLGWVAGLFTADYFHHH